MPQNMVVCQLAVTPILRQNFVKKGAIWKTGGIKIALIPGDKSGKPVTIPLYAQYRLWSPRVTPSHPKLAVITPSQPQLTVITPSQPHLAVKKWN